jgi:hypothetical protein
MRKDLSTESIIVLGSKPKASLPLVKVDTVITANGAVELALPYREKYGARIIAMVPGRELIKHDHIQQSFIKGQPDEIILLGEDSNEAISLIENILKLNDSKIIVFGPRKRLGLMKKILGWNRFFVLFEQFKSRGIKTFSGSVWPSCSTGLNAIFYALIKFPNAKIVTGGIGLVSGEHFNRVGQFTPKTAKSDQIVVKHWPRNKRPEVCTTDEIMSEVGDFPKWGGETFSAS